MIDLIKKIKALNRERLKARRQAKLQHAFDNTFDRSGLTLSSLRGLLEQRQAVNTHPMGRVAVYSTFCGSTSARTFNEQGLDPKIDHYFISNNPQILQTARALGWHGIKLELPVSSNRVLSAQQSKIPKALPHLFADLKAYDYLLYVDDKIRFDTRHLRSWVDQMENQRAAMMMRLHPDLKANVLNELATAMMQPRYQAQKEQMTEYVSLKVAQGFSLRVDRMFWTSAILRRMRHPSIESLNEDWYDNILSCGIECQLSFDFVAQRHDCIIEMPQQID